MDTGLSIEVVSLQEHLGLTEHAKHDSTIQQAAGFRVKALGFRDRENPCTPCWPRLVHSVDDLHLVEHLHCCFAYEMHGFVSTPGTAPWDRSARGPHPCQHLAHQDWAVAQLRIVGLPHGVLHTGTASSPEDSRSPFTMG